MARVTPSTTPNPNAMKFTLDVTLSERIDTTRGEGTESPFARAMLEVDGVASVFGVNDFVTITRDPDAEWDPIVCAVEDAAAAHLDASGPAPAGDEVAEARKLLRNAVAPPKPRPVEIGRRPPEPEST
jgi:hypothetical protein